MIAGLSSALPSLMKQQSLGRRDCMMATAGLKPSGRKFDLEVTRDPATILAAQRLRYQVFAEEMGAALPETELRIDRDDIDSHCSHLVVRARQSGEIAAYTRLISQPQANRIGQFYSAGEFDLDPVLRLRGRFLEIGRTCVAPPFRGGIALAVLWSGLVSHCRQEQVDYLIGCASVPPQADGYPVKALEHQLTASQRAPLNLHVRPRQAVPPHLHSVRLDAPMPPLLAAYLRFGAQVCGAPCWDREFNVMDVFILLDLKRVNQRYERHFFGQPRSQPSAAVAVG